MKELMIAAFGAILGVILTEVARLWNKQKEDKKDIVPKNKNSSVLLTNELIETFSPNRSYSKVAEILGLPDKSGEDYSIFESEKRIEKFEKKYIQICIF